MNFLVAIDKKGGNFLGVELLRQHEPVFSRRTGGRR